MTRERALQLRAMIEKASVSLPDEDALEAVELFAAWVADTAYVADQPARTGFYSYGIRRRPLCNAGRYEL